MERVLTPKERIILIRKGNELFNNGEIDKAAKIYITTAYKDGLIRVGDHYWFEQKNPFKALHFYLEAQYEKRIQELSERMAEVIKKWLREDTPQGNDIHEKTEKGP
jgi:mannose/cellobiose epimerase-like protein (N-acyl-D-glucosamine 2-epimerase family)